MKHYDSLFKEMNIWLGHLSSSLSASTCQVIMESSYSVFCDLSSCHKYAVNFNANVTSLVKFASGKKVMDIALGFLLFLVFKACV
jgi:hypothetical protein